MIGLQNKTYKTLSRKSVTQYFSEAHCAVLNFYILERENCYMPVNLAETAQEPSAKGRSASALGDALS